MRGARDMRLFYISIRTYNPVFMVISDVAYRGVPVYLFSTSLKTLAVPHYK